MSPTIESNQNYQQNATTIPKKREEKQKYKRRIKDSGNQTPIENIEQTIEELKHCEIEISSENSTKLNAQN